MKFTVSCCQILKMSRVCWQKSLLFIYRLLSFVLGSFSYKYTNQNGFENAVILKLGGKNNAHQLWETDIVTYSGTTSHFCSVCVAHPQCHLLFVIFHLYLSPTIISFAWNLSHFSRAAFAGMQILRVSSERAAQVLWPAHGCRSTAIWHNQLPDFN